VSFDPSPALKSVALASKLAAAAAKDRSRIAGALKDDRSPVTVADLAVQALITLTLRALGESSIDRLVAEESGDTLHGNEGVRIGNEVLALLEVALAPTSLASFMPGSIDEVRSILDGGGFEPTADETEPYWCLDPIDGTKGFLRGGQFAIALARIESNEPVFGVLGCPHLPLGEAADYGAVDAHGSTYVGIDGFAGAALGAPESLDEFQAIRVASTPADGVVRTCLSYERAHSDTDRTSSMLEEAGIAVKPIRIDSQCKYAMVASGRADLYLRLARGDYREKAWDHAAGAAVVRAAGGVVEDTAGSPVTFEGTLLDVSGGICVRTPAIPRPSRA
jgi:HAL2 family 3'(2'),5'-bisphosphate nucleotidase